MDLRSGCLDTSPAIGRQVGNKSRSQLAASCGDPRAFVVQPCAATANRSGEHDSLSLLFAGVWSLTDAKTDVDAGIGRHQWPGRGGVGHGRPPSIHCPFDFASRF